MEYVGLTKQQVEEKLHKQGINNITFINNFKNPLPNSVLLVTSCNIKDKTAQVILGCFKLHL